MLFLRHSVHGAIYYTPCPETNEATVFYGITLTNLDTVSQFVA